MSKRSIYIIVPFIQDDSFVTGIYSIPITCIYTAIHIVVL